MQLSDSCQQLERGMTVFRSGEVPRVLIFIVAYNAESTITKVLTRIPQSLKQYHTEVLIIDDASADQTYEMAEQARREGLIDYPITVLRNPVNQRYGGNQKLATTMPSRMALMWWHLFTATDNTRLKLCRTC